MEGKLGKKNFKNPYSTFSLKKVFYWSKKSQNGRNLTEAVRHRIMTITHFDLFNVYRSVVQQAIVLFTISRTISFQDAIKFTFLDVPGRLDWLVFSLVGFVVV